MLCGRARISRLDPDGGMGSACMIYEVLCLALFGVLFSFSLGIG
jgi:hypothetical protein